MFCLSSPKPNNPTHWFGRMVLKPNLYKNAKVINFSQVCNDCYKKNSSLVSCEHVKIKTSRLKGRLDELAELGDWVSSELGGVQTGTSHAAFRIEEIEKLFTFNYSMKYDEKKVPYFLLCCDPSYGGWNKTAITIGYLDDNGNHVLCWLTSYSVKDYQDYLDIIYNTVINFRKVYGKNKWINVVYETGSRWDASEIQEKMDALSRSNSYFLRIKFLVDAYKKNKLNEKSRVVPGIIATRERLNDMVSFFARGLHEKKIYISENFDIYSLEETNKEKELNILKEELISFRHYIENENLKYDHSKKRLKNNSGKVGKTSDDGAIAFQMLIYWGEQLKYNLEYTVQIGENIKFDL